MMKKGFSMIELIVVIAIMGILMTLAGPKIVDTMNKASAEAILSQINLVETGLNRYYGAMGSYPYYLTLLNESPATTNSDGSMKYDAGWDAFSVALTGNKGDDDPDLRETWGGPYVNAEESPDAKYCLKSDKADSICFGAMVKLNAGKNVFSTNGGALSAPFNSGANPSITNGKKSNGSDNTSDAYYNVIQINGLSKAVAVKLFVILNKHQPAPEGNLVAVAQGTTSDILGIPALSDYSKFNRVIIRYSDNY